MFSGGFQRLSFSLAYTEKNGLLSGYWTVSIGFLDRIGFVLWFSRIVVVCDTKLTTSISVATTLSMSMAENRG